MLDVITGPALQPVQKSALCPTLNLGCSQAGCRKSQERQGVWTVLSPSHGAPGPDIRGPQGTSEITLRLGFLVPTS